MPTRGLARDAVTSWTVPDHFGPVLAHQPRHQPHQDVLPSDVGPSSTFIVPGLPASRSVADGYASAITTLGHAFQN